MTSVDTGRSVTSEATLEAPTALVPRFQAVHTSVDRVSQEVRASEVLVSFLPVYEAMPRAGLLQVNLDIPGAVTLILGRLAEIRSYREQIVEAIRTYDIALFDQLEGCAIALNDAHGNYEIAVEASTDLQSLLTEAARLRQALLADATSLVHHGLVDSRRLKELKGAVGHRNVVADLNVLRKALQASWLQIAGKCPTTQLELDRAEKLQLRLMRLMGEKLQGAPNHAATRELRQRAFTYFVRCYDHVRRALSFLRWDQRDVDKIAPSLYAGRGTGRRKHNAAAAANGVNAALAVNAEADTGETANAAAKALAITGGASPFASLGPAATAPPFPSNTALRAVPQLETDPFLS